MRMMRAANKPAADRAVAAAEARADIEAPAEEVELIKDEVSKVTRKRKRQADKSTEE